MSKEKTSISPRLLWPLLVIPPLGFGLLNFPYFAAHTAGPSGYLVLPVAVIMALPGLAAVYLLARRFPGQTLIEQGISVLGSWLGRLTGAIYLGVSLLLLTQFARDLTNMTSTYLNERTPLYILVLALVIVEAYLATRGIETISRLASFVMVPALSVLFVLIALGYQNVEWSHLFPIPSAGFGRYVKGGWSVLYIFYLLSITGMILPFLRPVTAFPRTAATAMLVLVLIFGAVVVGSIGVFGPAHSERFAWPTLEFIHVLDYPFLLFEQAGLVLIIDWLALIVVAAGYLCFTIAAGFSQIVNRWDYKRFVWIIAFVKFALFFLPRSVAQTKQFFGYISWWGWTAFFAYPLVLLLLAAVTGRRGQAGAR